MLRTLFGGVWVIWSGVGCVSLLCLSMLSGLASAAAAAVGTLATARAPVSVVFINPGYADEPFWL
jgi:hypothetical protein